MTRKDYERFAVALKVERDSINAFDAPHVEEGIEGFDYAVRTMALVMKQDSPRFDEQRFYAAVGMEG